jgi:putative transposase
MSAVISNDVDVFLDATKDAREYKRAMAVKMLLLDYQPRDIAVLLNVTEAFVSKWKGLYFEHGADVFVVKYHGYQGYFTPEQRQSIIEKIKTEKIWDVDALAAFIKTTYDVEFKSRQSYYELFAAAGITWKRAQSQNPGKDPERIASKKKTLRP